MVMLMTSMAGIFLEKYKMKTWNIFVYKKEDPGSDAFEFYEKTAEGTQ